MSTGFLHASATLAASSCQTNMQNDRSQNSAAAANVELWCIPAPELLDPALEPAYRNLLSAEEAARWQRYARADDRARFLTTRALLRTVLSERLGLAPADLCFSVDRWGKPHVVRAATAPVVHFNLSHARGMAVLAVCGTAAVGVDVEDERRAVNAEALTLRYFAPEELAALRALPEDMRRLSFLHLWTLKEAYVKALGMGLRIPLDRFAFALRDDTVEFLRREGKGADVPLAMRSVAVAPHHRVGLAVATPHLGDVTIFEGMPLQEFSRKQ